MIKVLSKVFFVVKMKGGKRKRDKSDQTASPAAKKNNIPIYKSKSKMGVSKHASLLKRPETLDQDVGDKYFRLPSGVLISCQSSSDARALHHSIQFLTEMVEKLYPDALSLWDNRPKELDVLPLPAGVGALNVDDKDGKDSELDDLLDGATLSPSHESVRKDKKIIGVDTACGGVVFARLKVDVDAVELMMNIFGELKG